MRILTGRGWVVAIGSGILAATLTFLGLIQIRHWLADEAQLHEIVALIQAGRLKIEPPPPPPPVAPVGK